MTQTKRMSIKEFRDLGYLQELNRRFLNPLGLALEVAIQENGQEYLVQIWDSRDDPEGMIFGPGMIDPEKAKHIYDEGAQRQRKRIDALGYYIQPEK